jgi:phenylpropionate dioxygenase-like ring-hydroxylating dioxygenase large terminal subunit
MAADLGAAAYTEGDFFQQEKRTVFSREWLPIAHEGQLPAAGDFVSHTVGGWPVFAARGAHGEVKAFRNACRHQNMLVLDKPSGHCSEFRCRFHGWTYDIGGRFVSAPAPVAPADPASPVNHLHALATAIVGGLVLFSLSEEPAAATLGEAGALIERSLGPHPRHAGATTSDIGCNWKVFLEHALASGTCSWAWPLVIAREHEGGVVLEQVVPRTFLRTRLVRHFLVPPDDPREMPASLAAEAVAEQVACEALQAARTEGKAADATHRIAELHSLLARAFASDAAS